jgi:hypothetical protein
MQPPPGFTKIPGSSHGYSKGHGKDYEYWSPNTGDKHESNQGSPTTYEEAADRALDRTAHAIDYSKKADHNFEGPEMNYINHRMSAHAHDDAAKLSQRKSTNWNYHREMAAKHREKAKRMRSSIDHDQALSMHAELGMFGSDHWKSHHAQEMAHHSVGAQVAKQSSGPTHPFIGPRGGKWADPEHTVPWGYRGEHGGSEHVKALRNHLHEHHNLKSLTLTHNSRKKHTTLHDMVVPKSERGKGTGNAVMDAIKRFSDKHKHTTTLTPEPIHGQGGSKSKLRKWYKSHDFVDNKGRNKDYEISEGMYRLPKQANKQPKPGHPFIGPQGGLWADPEHTIHWEGPPQTGPKYPMADRGEWYGDSDYKARGGHMVSMPPEQYLKRVRPLEVDEGSRDNIDDLKNHMQSGRTLDPLVIYEDGKEDGRHRAHAAKELGMSHVPVILFGDQIHKPAHHQYQPSPSKVAHIYIIGKTFNFEKGEQVLFGKYKNKLGIIKGFSTDDKGNPIVIVEPVPKGRKKDKEIQLFRVWKKKANLSPTDVHELADEIGIKWDNDPTFMEWTQRLTNKEHLDDMSQGELKTVMDGLRSRQFSKKVADRWLESNTPEPVNPYLNTPPTVLRRMVDNATGKDKELITRALSAYVGTHSWLAPDLRAFV